MLNNPILKDINETEHKKESIWTRLPDSRLLVEASLWSADFKFFAREMERIDPYADMYHIDVADGHFVPGFLFFADLVAGLRPLTKKPFHVHLMTDNPINHVDDFIAAGADLVTVHMENGPIVPAVLNLIHRKGAASGLALGLDVPIETIKPYLELTDLILIMGTPMGIKGVKPSPFVYERVNQTKKLILSLGLQNVVKVFADGGIRENTVPELRASGVDGVVAGSLAFKSNNLDETFRWFHSLETNPRRLT